MGFHYGYEKRKFDAEWTRLEQEYRAAGMNDRQIAAMKEYDWTWFCSQRTYQNRVQALPSEQCEDESEQSCLFRKFESLSYTWDTGDVDAQRFGWLSSLEDELLYRRLCKLPEDDLELLTLLIVDGYRQADVARLWNSTNLNCDAKFQNVKNSAFILRRMNDELCRAYGLSVIENPKKKAKSQKETAAAQYGVSHKKQLQQTIDRVLPECNNYEEFLSKMRAEGYEVIDGKNPGFRLPGWERPTRTGRLGENYTKTALRARITSQRGRSATEKTMAKRTGRKVNLLIDIQAKLAIGKGAGYERWAKIFNLKEAAKTLNFLMENGLTDYDELVLRAEQSEDGFNAASQKIKQLEVRMAGVAQLKTHIIQYSKTREIYAAYKKSRHKKEFLAEYGAEIAQHEAAKKAFDALDGKPIPKVAQLSKEYAALLEEKREQYEQYKVLRQDIITYQTALRNVDKILGLEPLEQTQEKEQKKPER